MIFFRGLWKGLETVEGLKNFFRVGKDIVDWLGYEYFENSQIVINV